MTLAEISSSTPFERSRVSGPWSWQVWFFAVPSEDLHQMTGRGGVRQIVVSGSTAPGTSGLLLLSLTDEVIECAGRSKVRFGSIARITAPQH